MAAVKTIGDGYYGIVADGVSVGQDVAVRIDKAFEDAIAGRFPEFRKPAKPRVKDTAKAVKARPKAK
jgi:hypothetical protein